MFLNSTIEGAKPLVVTGWIEELSNYLLPTPLKRQLVKQNDNPRNRTNHRRRHKQRTWNETNETYETALQEIKCLEEATVTMNGYTIFNWLRTNNEHEFVTAFVVNTNFVEQIINLKAINQQTSSI